ncbi:MAG: hypothetical protein RL293_585 [Bacteroidota bacterium]
MKTFLRISVKWILIPLLSICLLISGLVFFFKDRICGLVLTEVNTHLNVPLNVSEMDLVFWSSFPNLSVDFEHLFIQESLPNAQVSDTLFYTDQLRLTFNPWDIYQGKYHVKRVKVSPGKLAIRYDARGKENFDIFKPSPSDTKTDFNLSLKEVKIDGLRFIYDNVSSKQYLSSTFEDARIKGDFSSDAFVAKAMGKMKLGRLKSGEITLLRNKNTAFNFALDVNQLTGIYSLKNAELSVEHLPFSVNGRVSPDSLQFTVQSKNIQLTQLVNEFSLDAAKDVKTFKGSGKVDFHLDLAGAISAVDPIGMNADFGIENGELTEPEHGLKIQDIQLSGKYSNTGEKGEYISMKNVRFRTAGGPFSGEVELREFDRPKVEGSAKGNVDLALIHSIFHLPSIDEVRGNLGIQTNFKLATNPEGELAVDQCNGQLELKNISLKLMADKRRFSEVNGRLFLRGNEAGIENTSLKLGSSDVKLNGIFDNIFPYINGKGDLKTSVLVESKHLYVEDLGSTSKEMKIETGQVYSLPDNIQGEINLQIEKLRYGKHEFSHLISKMNIEHRRLHFPQMSLVNAEGLLSGALIIEEKEPEKFILTTQIAGKNLKFKPLFKEWENFDQTVIREQNISGRAEANLFFRAPFTLAKGIIYSGIEAKLDLKVYNGHLKNVASFKDITESLKTKSGKLVLGKENIQQLEDKLKDVDFQTMENSIYIKNGQVEIPKMTIRSTALDMDVSGRHSFTDDIDYRFAFRFRDLKATKNQTEFGEVIDDGTGVRLFLRMHGTLEKPIYEWDSEGRKVQAKEYRQEEKAQAKSMLKAEFGFFQKDSTVKAYIPKDVPKEDLKIKFGPASKQEFMEEKKQTKDSKLKKTLNTWKQQQEKEQQTGVKLGSGGGK